MLSPWCHSRVEVMISGGFQLPMMMVQLHFPLPSLRHPQLIIVLGVAEMSTANRKLLASLQGCARANPPSGLASGLAVPSEEAPGQLHAAARSILVVSWVSLGSC